MKKMKPLEEDKPLKEKISISIDPDLLQELRKEALREERSLSPLFRFPTRG